MRPCVHKFVEGVREVAAKVLHLSFASDCVSIEICVVCQHSYQSGNKKEACLFIFYGPAATMPT